MSSSVVLDRYRYIARLGAGGSSTVVLAEDTLLGRRVALKRIHAPDDVAARSRLRREALVGASLSHPNLVSIYDIVTTEEGEEVIVMEYVEGETLADLLRRGERLPVPKGLDMLTGVSAALDAIHAQKIVHRDVKPANVLLGVDGSVKLADLGIAAVPDRTHITTAGAVMGTFRYMPPEQLEGTVATPAVDIYALAALAFEALSGEAARHEQNPLALVHAIATQSPPDLRKAWPEAPAAAAQVLTKGMSRDPSERPHSAGELTAQLRTALAPQPVAPVAPVPAEVSAAPRPERSVAAAAAEISAAPRPDRGVAAVPAEVSSAPASERRRGPARRAEPARRPAPARQPAPIRRPAAASAETPNNKAPRRRGGVLLAAAAAFLAACAVAAIVLANTGGSHGRPATRSAARTTSASKQAVKSAKSTKTRTKSHPAAAAQSGSNIPPVSNTPPASNDTPAVSNIPPVGSSVGSPVSAVESFYHLAASHQYAAAWALADPSFRAQLAGFQGLEATMAQERWITFNGANVVNQSPGSATVSVQTTSVRSDGTQSCYGTVDLLRGAAPTGWLLDHIQISCV